MTARARTRFTATTFDEMERDPRWLGWGYLGGRRNALDSDDPECPPMPKAVAQADAFVLNRASDLGWTYEDLFAWANSKLGRWTADALIYDYEMAMARNYLRLPEDPA